MVDGKMAFLVVEDDREYERTAWFTSLIMTASGNYGKKGIEAKKLYTRQYDDMGNALFTEDGQSAFTPIDKETKERKLSELIAKFNKEGNEDS